MITPDSTKPCPDCGEQAEYDDTLDMLWGWRYKCSHCDYSFWWGLEQYQ